MIIQVGPILILSMSVLIILILYCLSIGGPEILMDLAGQMAQEEFEVLNFMTIALWSLDHLCIGYWAFQRRA